MENVARSGKLRGMKAFHLALAFVASTTAFARLGETEAQSTARYGAQDNNLIAGKEEPLVPGARELAYTQPGWRIRAAYVGGVTVRIEYRKGDDADGGRKITPEDVKAILAAEKGRYAWRAHLIGKGGKRARIDEDKATNWERSDSATAQVGGQKIVITARDADDVAAKLAKQPTGAKAAATPAAKPRF